MAIKYKHSCTQKLTKKKKKMNCKKKMSSR